MYNVHCAYTLQLHTQVQRPKDKLFICTYIPTIGRFDMVSIFYIFLLFQPIIEVIVMAPEHFPPVKNENDLPAEMEKPVSA